MDGHSAAGSGSGARKKTPSASKSSLTTLFDKYKDSEEPDVILVEGTELLCQDLQVDPTDRVVLSLAWHLKCEAMCEFKRQGWMDGWSELQYELSEFFLPDLYAFYLLTTLSIDATRSTK